jgi:hypothetical protein
MVGLRVAPGTDKQKGRGHRQSLMEKTLRVIPALKLQDRIALFNQLAATAVPWSL